ncbi:FIMAH domain-containing protein [Paenibacillus senegalensis]|uniref:FIMAH domain-containing protein n=1 Tax=Paenibacillus senegalensis TaxID=1465766 RepID=UPI000288F719|nr:hypothetical protein [Paenibacillus senegalensis]
MIRSGRPLFAGLFALLLIIGCFPAGASSQQNPFSESYENLGTALKRVVGIGGTPFEGPDGTPYISAAVNGAPAQFVVIHALTLEVEYILPIPNASSSITAVKGSDGKIYIGTNGTGEMFRYTPGEDALEPLGQPVAGQTYIYGLVNGPGGKVYGGTYPGGRMFEFDPASDQFTDLGNIIPGEQYVRQLAYDEERELFYVGTGTSNKLVEFDPATGEVSGNWMPESLSVEEYPNSINVIGSKLFIQLNRSSMMIIMDKYSKQIEHQITGVSSSVIGSPDGGKAYIFMPSDAHLHEYDFATGEINPVVRLGGYNGWKSVRISQTGTEAAPESILSAWGGYSAALSYNLTTGELRSRTVDVPGQPIEIRSIAGGPDGRVYVSGIQGGTAIYDPVSGIMESRTSGMSQAEGITAIGDVMYFGIYPQARLSVFDTASPWQSGNPQEVARFPADALQDRPFGMAASEEWNKVFIGTVPQYGQLGGAFAIYDPVSRSLDVMRNLVEDQSIVTLVYHNGKVYGGTSIWGAYGAPAPSATEGKLFVWDVETGEKELEMTPVAGKKAVTSVIVGPDGYLWGFAEGVLFIFDPDTQAVIEQHPVMDISYGGTIWSDAFLVSAADGNVYGTARGIFFRIDGQTKSVTILDNTRQFGNVTQDSAGALYLRSGVEGARHELWRYTNTDLELAGLQTTVQNYAQNGQLPEPIVSELINLLRQTSHHLSNGRNEQAVHFLNKAKEKLDKAREDWADSEAIKAELAAKLDEVISLISRQ